MTSANALLIARQRVVAHWPMWRIPIASGAASTGMLIRRKVKVACNIRCPLNGQVCDDCTNAEHPGDGQYPDVDVAKPSDRDWGYLSSRMLRAGSFGI